MNRTHSLDAADLEARAAWFFDRPGLSMPAWIDSTRLSVLDDRTGIPQLSIVDITTGDIRPVTAFGERILSLLASPSGATVFGMDTGGDENQQLWKLDPATESPIRITNVPKARFEPGAISTDGSIVLATSNARDNSMFDIVGVNLETGEQEMWLEESGTATAYEMAQDGSRALIKKLNTNLDAELILVEIATKACRTLTQHEGEAWSYGGGFGTAENEVWHLTNEGREFVQLVVFDIDSGERRVVAESAWDIEAASPSPDGEIWAIAENTGGWSGVSFRIGNQARTVTPLEGLPRGTVDRFSWSPDGTHLAFGLSTATSPSVIILATPDGQWTSFELDAPGGAPPVVEPELVTFTATDGLEIPAFLFKPAGEGPFPVLVEIHGGPESQRRLQYSSAVPTDQFIQSLGIAVLSLNVRGSTGYGKTYSHLDDRDKRLDSVTDVMAAVAWIREQPTYRADRIAVMGQSYGGFMTLASIAFHPGNWAAAVDVVGIASFTSFLERTGAWRRKHRSEEYGFLETDREMLERISPLNAVDAIDTPLFVIHGRNDPRVPLFEAEQIVHALESRGQVVELRVFDNEGHGLSKRQNRVTGYAAAAGFLARHLLH